MRVSRKDRRHDESFASSPSARDSVSARSEGETLPIEGNGAASGMRAARTQPSPRATEGWRSASNVEPAAPRRDPEWCIDLGEKLATMTTFELWSALATSVVPSRSRVWREGMECWTPAFEVPDLACAVPGGDDDSVSPRPVTVDFERLRKVRDLGADSADAVDRAEAREAKTPRPGARMESAESLRAGGSGEGEAPSPAAAAGFFEWASHWPIALGAGFAAASMLLALVIPVHPADPVALAKAGLGAAVSEMAWAPASSASVLPIAASEAPAPIALQRAERGQRRLRTGHTR